MKQRIGIAAFFVLALVPSLVWPHAQTALFFVLACAAIVSLLFLKR